MANTVNQSKKAPLNIKYPAYVRISEKEDLGAADYYESNNIPVRTIHINGTSYRCAIIDAGSQEEANKLNRIFNSMNKNADRKKKTQAENETSYDALVECGYDVAKDDSDPQEIYAEIVVVEALLKELDDLTTEERNICKMVGNKIPERDAAEKFGMPRSTLRDRKIRLLKELNGRLKDYK